MKLVLENLDPLVTEREIIQLLSQYGNATVEKLTTRGPIGYRFGAAVVEIPSLEGRTAIAELSGKTFRRRNVYLSSLEPAA